MSNENFKEKIKEEIHYRTELIKVLAFFLLTTIGGEISLFLKGFSTKSLVLFFLGIPTIILLGFALWLEHQKVVKLLKALEEEDV